jgi:hypothetical protein
VGGSAGVFVKTFGVFFPLFYVAIFPLTVNLVVLYPLSFSHHDFSGVFGWPAFLAALRSLSFGTVGGWVYFFVLFCATYRTVNMCFFSLAEKRAGSGRAEFGT